MLPSFNFSPELRRNNKRRTGEADPSSIELSDYRAQGFDSLAFLICFLSL
jgi:hypothetical protein